MDLFGYVGGKHRHGTLLSADIGRCVDCLLVSFDYRFSLKDVGDESGCERVTGSYRVGYFYLGSWLERYISGVKT